jgi:hypothetical protein
MKISPNSANQRSLTSANLSSKEKNPRTTKVQDQRAAMAVDNIITQSESTTSTQMGASLRKTGRRILDHLQKKGVREFSIIEQIITAIDWACQAAAEVAAEAH